MSSAQHSHKVESTNPQYLKLWLVLLTLLGAALRLRGLFANSFLPDESLFATWARFIATWRDPLLLDQWVDKPPLLFYLQALFYPMFGPAEFPARLPNMAASIILIPLVGILCWRLFRDGRSAAAAAGFTAISPLLIQFSATAFIDPLLSTLVLASLVLAAAVRPDKAERLSRPSLRNNRQNTVLSGILFGLALAAKYQALLTVPLFVGLFLIFRWKRIYWLRWLEGFVAVLLLLGLWDLLRRGAPSIIGSQMMAYGGLRLSWSWELADRLTAWSGLWRYLTGSAALSMILLTATPLLFIAASNRRNEHSALDQLLALFTAGYFLLHWLVAVPIWDRYLVLLAPLFAIMSSRVLVLALDYVKNTRIVGDRGRRISPLILTAAFSALLVIILPASFAAYWGQLPVGGRPDSDGGIGTLSRTLVDEPPGSVLYDHWNSWQWRYHLYDTNMYVSWFPGPEALVEDLRVFGQKGDSRYVAMPDSKEAWPVLRAMQAAGFEVEVVPIGAGLEGKTTIRLYRIESP